MVIVALSIGLLACGDAEREAAMREEAARAEAVAEAARVEAARAPTPDPAPVVAAPSDDPTVRARRLAHGMYADIATYSAGPAVGVEPERVAIVLAAPISEARVLFVSLQPPELQPIFDEELAYLVREVGPQLRVETPESARYFATMLVADARRAPDPAAQLVLARTLYQSRAAAPLHSIFEEVAAAPP